jgi:hypothetical protein
MSPAPWNSEPQVIRVNPELIDDSTKKCVLMRPSPIVHPAVDAPICAECLALESTFFNPQCCGCQNELDSMDQHGIGVASIMAILRQWIPMVRIIWIIFKIIFFPKR